MLASRSLPRAQWNNRETFKYDRAIISEARAVVLVNYRATREDRAQVIEGQSDRQLILVHQVAADGVTWCIGPQTIASGLCW